ncbi:MAG: Maf family nucleotide pyrophosphatase [Roseovarius sp.]|nr:Maf family nucleotide pyrophosphatase [Roseovarius sp.]
MSTSLILASGSETRQALLRQAGIAHEAIAARVDEDAVKQSLLAEGASPRDVADALAELKARKISDKHPGAMVIGCDQVLNFDGRILSKPTSQKDVIDQLTAMQGNSHELLSAVVVCEGSRPVWREVAKVTLVMRPLSGDYIQAYVDRNWDSIQHSVGGYKLEEEGVRLFTQIKGDYFTVLGLSMLSLISYLNTRGILSQ